MESRKHVQDLMRSITESLTLFKSYLLTHPVRPINEGEYFMEWHDSVLSPHCEWHFALQYFVLVHEQGAIRLARSTDPYALELLEGLEEKLRPVALQLQITNHAENSSTGACTLSTGIPRQSNAALMQQIKDFQTEFFKKFDTFDKKVDHNKRARGKDGGRPPDDGQEQSKLAVAKVLELRYFNKSKSMTMERACRNVIKELTLTVHWQALAKQVRQSPKWEALKKRIRIARK